MPIVSFKELEELPPEERYKFCRKCRKNLPKEKKCVQFTYKGFEFNVPKSNYICADCAEKGHIEAFKYWGRKFISKKRGKIKIDWEFYTDHRFDFYNKYNTKAVFNELSLLALEDEENLEVTINDKGNRKHIIDVYNLYNPTDLLVALGVLSYENNQNWEVLDKKTGIRETFVLDPTDSPLFFTNEEYAESYVDFLINKHRPLLGQYEIRHIDVIKSKKSL